MFWRVQLQVLNILNHKKKEKKKWLSELFSMLNLEWDAPSLFFQLHTINKNLPNQLKVAEIRHANSNQFKLTRHAFSDAELKSDILILIVVSYLQATENTL